MTRHFIASELLSYFSMHSASQVVFVGTTGRCGTTYGDVGTMVEAKVRRLRELGVAPRDRIGLLGGNSLEWMTWDIAILVADAVPLVFTDEHAKLHHEALMAQYGCSHVIVADRSGADAVISRSRTAASGEPGDVREDPDVFTLVFSSGTTGKTKGLSISRRGVEHILDQFIDAYEVCREDRYYSFLPFNYFQQRALYLAALAVGADIVVVPPANFIQHFISERPTFSVNPPVFYDTIYNHHRALEKLGRATSLRELLGGNIRWMITAMAPIKRHVLDYFWQNGVGLYETYGVTETGLVTWNTLRDYKVGTVGKPANDAKISLTEQNEVLIKRKVPLAIDYFDVPSEDERDVFLPDGSIATGDVATIDADGYMTLIGRTKNAIVTAQGKKFHPEELEKRIEAQIHSHLAVVVGGANVCENTLLLAPRREDMGSAVADELLTSCVEELNASVPTHQRLHSFVVLQEPFSVAKGHLTRNFKLDRMRVAEALLSGDLSGRSRRVFGSKPSVLVERGQHGY